MKMRKFTDFFLIISVILLLAEPVTGWVGGAWDSVADLFVVKLGVNIPSTTGGSIFNVAGGTGGISDLVSFFNSDNEETIRFYHDASKDSVLDMYDDGGATLGLQFKSDTGISIYLNREMRFFDNDANYTGFEAQEMSGNQIYILPAADGNNGEFLSTNGSGTLSWQAGS